MRLDQEAKTRAYVAAVQRILLQRGAPTPEQRRALKDKATELLHVLDCVAQRRYKGPRANVVAAAQRRATQPFTISWPNGAHQALQGWRALTEATGLQPESLRVMLSKGKGSFTRLLDNPLTGEPDTATITRVKQ